MVSHGVGTASILRGMLNQS